VQLPAGEAVLVDTPPKFSAQKTVLIGTTPQVFDMRSMLGDTLLPSGGRGRRVFGRYVIAAFGKKRLYR
jgi:hypothetical protein